MLAGTLQSLIDDGKTTAREISELTGKAPSTVYRWVSGKSEPDFNSIRLLLRHLPDKEAQRSLLSTFTAGTSWQSAEVELDLDGNHDGKVNAEDALDATIRAVRLTGQSLEQVREACREGRVDARGAVRIIQLLDEVVSHCSVAKQVVVQECEKRDRSRLKLVK